MLFNEKEYRCCANCSKAIKFDSKTMLCIRKGMVSADRVCGAFRYDPLKRLPPKPVSADFSDLCNADFSLVSENDPAE